MDYVTVAQALLPDLKQDRQMTYEDPDRAARVLRFCIDGMAWLDSVMPAPLDYQANLNARRLLFAYVMYAESQAVDEFETNYYSQILGLKLDAERDAYLREVADAEDVT